MSGDESHSGDKGDDDHVKPIGTPLYPRSAVMNIPLSDPISESEYDRWLTPSHALAVVGDVAPYEAVIDAFLTRLGVDLIQAAAELMTLSDKQGQSSFAYMPVPAQMWRMASSPDSDSLFWTHGNMTFSTAAGYEISAANWVAFTGVKFDPVGIEKLRRALDPISPATVPDRTSKLAPPDPAHEPKPPPEGEAKKFARALLYSWPESSTEFAHKKAVGFFSENKVPRDWFLKIFREIRGPKKPGKPRKNRN